MDETHGHNIGAAESSDISGKSNMTEHELLKEIKALRNENRKLKTKISHADPNETNDVELLVQQPEATQHVRYSRARIDTSSPVMSGISPASMSGMPINALGIPECLPSDGETEIDRKSYEHWKQIMEASLDLMKSTDEKTRMGIFKIKAGAKLLEVYESTATRPGMPDEKMEPYSNALARLNEYFGSRTYILSQRSKLINMVQRRMKIVFSL
ncbi:uncharacterized protein LOC134207093 [Armigeres subalbatus]|uniref:uncharacterized protein LOC134207093 n=1 Tax=Armigeres subalbatus TaxID=124917 RepID=UPI002ED48336